MEQLSEVLLWENLILRIEPLQSAPLAFRSFVLLSFDHNQLVLKDCVAERADLGV